MNIPKTETHKEPGFYFFGSELDNQIEWTVVEVGGPVNFARQSFVSFFGGHICSLSEVKGVWGDKIKTPR